MTNEIILIYCLTGMVSEIVTNYDPFCASFYAIKTFEFR